MPKFALFYNVMNSRSLLIPINHFGDPIILILTDNQVEFLAMEGYVYRELHLFDVK